jgi:glycosyltransferase involved in cell wall biosynthesis
MKVLVLNNAVPFIRGGAEELAEHLVQRLNNTPGVEAELLRIPFRWETADRVLEEILINRNLRLYKVDRVLALKFPAYLVQHESKILWLLHQFRQAYDLCELGLSHLCGHANGKEIARIVREADNRCFAECKAIYCNSPVTQVRLKKFNGYDATVLYPPLNDPEQFQGGDYGNYIFAGGRVGPGKRQHLLVEAMRYVRSTMRLVIAGPPDDDQCRFQLEKISAQYDLADRVALRFGYRPRREIAELMNGALACAYLPIDEDSLGYVTMEAFCAAKPVLTSEDAGGLLEIVHNEQTGFVVAPQARAIARAIDRLAQDVGKAKAMGRAGKELLESKNLSWGATIQSLLS